MKYLIVGLGNVGPEYELSRHNIGFSIIDQIAEKFDLNFSIEKHAEYRSFKYKSRNIYLLKPSTFVNNSGKAVNYWLSKLKINSDNLIVLLDDLSLPFGKIRIKKSGSDGGHNGLKSINEILNTTNYIRLRFGIDNNFRPGYQSEYVLSKFSNSELNEIELLKIKCTDIILEIIVNGTERTMNKFN